GLQKRVSLSHTRAVATYATRAAPAASCCAQRLLPLRTPPSTSVTVLRPVSCIEHLCPRQQYSAATAGSNNRQPSHRRCFNRQGNALQFSHRNWIKPRLASGRSSDSRIFEFEIPS